VHQPDACLLDVSFPDASGLSVIGLIHAASPATKIIILSGSTDQTVVAEAIGKGAHGFVSKERPVSDIIAALERARDGHMAVDSDLLQQVQSSRESADNPLWVLRFLTDREWEVMRCILDGQTTEEMARNLGVQRSTARTHVQNLLTKLGVHSRLQVAALMNAGGVPNGRPVPQD
jgi:two-component system nitrate/nitrite response regulator NarL